MLKAIASIMLGGSLGAVMRWGLHYLVDVRWSQSAFPLGILAVNVLGCFAFGFLFAWCETKQWLPDALLLGLFTGLLGSFTTFSTFSWDTLALLRDGHIGMALVNVAASVVLGLLALWVGLLLGR
ncbi:MAG: fluoride efflux transporter CrcB [Verrucomicrobiales bacterium]